MTSSSSLVLPGLIDTHMHLDHLGVDGPALVQAAVDVGVTGILANGVDPRRAAVIRGALPAGVEVRYAVGLHPQELPDLDDAGVEAAFVALEARLADRAERAAIAAIGECGLDARPGIGDDDEQKQRQVGVFRRHIAIARRERLPLVVHGVRRDGPLLELLRADVDDNGPLPAGGVWHGFSASKDTMRIAVDLGLHIAIGFMALNDKARRVQEAIPAIPDDRLLVETDAPPLPPARIVDVVAAVARARSTTPVALAALTADNARRLFGFS
ncbi:MAG TPA: TatD family hydrolase [Myxococcota bacterium]